MLFVIEPLIFTKTGDIAMIQESKTVQSYIDETPMWLDGTNLSAIPMTSMQWKIWGACNGRQIF